MVCHGTNTNKFGTVTRTVKNVFLRVGHVAPIWDSKREKVLDIVPLNGAQ